MATNEPRIDVCLTIDFDAISVWIGSMGSRSATNISRGEFGAIGAVRLLDTLKRYGLASTWFIPGHTMETFPKECRAIADAGHEVGHHNYLHESPRSLDAAAEQAVLERGIECIERLTGVRPQGFRAPGAELSPNTLPLLKTLGFAYDSSLMARDFELYYLREGDHAPLDGPFRFGQPLELVEVPMDWSLDDWPYFSLNFNSHHIGLRSADEVFGVWSQEFDYLYERIGKGVFTLTLHPQIMGRGHRLLMLERLIEHMQRPGVRFARAGDVVSEWKGSNPFAQAAAR